MNRTLLCFCTVLWLLLISCDSFAYNFNWRHPFDIGEEDNSTPAPKAGQSQQSEPLPTPPPLPAPIPYKATHKPMIAIVIDDMGVDLKRSEWALDLPAGVTMSYLPYARKIDSQVKEAKDKGHEILLHMPMQAESDGEDPGPYHISVGMSDAQLEKNIITALDSFKGYDGVNNHMGSKFTTYKPGLELFMTELEKRHVFFLDSRTTPQTVAEQVAREHHLLTTHRDVFLDHIETAEFVAAALNHTEDVARVTGAAVAIGHPKDVTLASLEAWLPTLKAKGFQVVSLSEVIKYRNEAQDADNK